MTIVMIMIVAEDRKDIKRKLSTAFRISRLFVHEHHVVTPLSSTDIKRRCT